MWWLVSVAVLVALVVVARLTLAHYTSAAYLERRLSAELTGATDSLYRITIGATSTSLLADRFVATDLVIGPDTVVSERRRKARTLPRVLYAASIPSLELRGIGLWALLRSRVSIGSVTLERPRFEISLDRRIREEHPGSPVALPHEALRELGRSVTVGSLNLLHGAVHYAERAVDGARPGRFQFEDVNLMVSSMTNRLPAGVTKEPVALELSALVAGKSKLEAKFDYDFASPKLTMSYRGTVGGIDGKAFNELLVNLEGTEVTSGRLDSAAFDVKVVDDDATGKVEALYHDVHLKVLSKDSHDQSLGDVFKTLVSNSFKLNSDNPEKGKPPRVPSIHLRREADRPLIKFLWITLRQGLAETLGLTSAPADRKSASVKKQSEADKKKQSEADKKKQSEADKKKKSEADKKRKAESDKKKSP